MTKLKRFEDLKENWARDGKIIGVSQKRWESVEGQDLGDITLVDSCLFGYIVKPEQDIAGYGFYVMPEMVEED